MVLAERTAHSTGLDQYPALDVATIGNECDLAVVVGGDGTMLGIGRQLARYGTPLIGINPGAAGLHHRHSAGGLPRNAVGHAGRRVREDHRSLMHGKVMREGECVFEAFAMNDVVVNRGAVANMVELRVEVNGHFVANHQADGIIVATPAGSTAYALSAGGPLLHPLVPAWALVPIAPHTLSNRPIVVADPVEIAIEIVSGKDASASFDMQSLASLHHGDRIVVRRSEFRVRFLHPTGWSYFDTLRKKLHWNEGGV